MPIRMARPMGWALPRLNRWTNLMTLKDIPYFFLRSEKTCSEDSGSIIRASPSTHVPLIVPRASQGAMRTRGLFRIRFIFPVLESVRTNSSPFSSMNQTGVRTASPVFRYVSRLMCFCRANWDNMSPAALNGDCSTVEVPLGDADSVSYTNQDDTVARLGLGSDLALDPVDRSVNSRLDQRCDRRYCFL